MPLQQVYISMTQYDSMLTHSYNTKIFTALCDTHWQTWSQKENLLSKRFSSNLPTLRNLIIQYLEKPPHVQWVHLFFCHLVGHWGQDNLLSEPLYHQFYSCYAVTEYGTHQSRHTEAMMSNKPNANFVSLGTDFIVNGILCIQRRLWWCIFSSATLLKAHTVTDSPSALFGLKHCHFNDPFYIKHFIKLFTVKVNLVTVYTVCESRLLALVRVWVQLLNLNSRESALIHLLHCMESWSILASVSHLSVAQCPVPSTWWWVTLHRGKNM